MSEDLPHKSGITTCDIAVSFWHIGVGRLAPQIGDYDFYKTIGIPTLQVSEDLPHKSGITTSGHSLYATFKGRKTCPTNRGLRPGRNDIFVKNHMSEDLPHKSGITTPVEYAVCLIVWSEDLPHKSGITTIYQDSHFSVSSSEDLPHKSGITTKCFMIFPFVNKSEDLPHKSGITTP